MNSVRRQKTIARVPSERDVPQWVRMFGAPIVVVASLSLALYSLAGRPLTHAAAAQQAVGAMMSCGQFVYRDIYSLDPPGVALFSRLINLTLGSSSTSMWFLDGLSTTLSALMVFFISRRFCASTLLAVIAGVSYPLLYYGVDHSVPALNTGWATTASLLAIYLVAARSNRAFTLRMLVSGFLTGAAITLDLFSLALVPLVIAVLYYQVKPNVFSRYLCFWVGSAFAPIVAIGVWVAANGAWGPMVGQLLGVLPARLSHFAPRGAPAVADYMGNGLIRVWLVGKLGWTLPGLFAFLAGIVALCRSRYGMISRLIALWMSLALIGLLAQVELKPAQWMQVFPAWCIVGAAGYELMLRRSTIPFWRYLAGVLLVIGCLTGLAQVREARVPVAQEQDVYTILEPLALKVAQTTSPSDTVLMWDVASQFYLLAGRPVAGGLVNSAAYLASDDSARFFWKSFRARPPKIALVYRTGGVGLHRLAPEVENALDQELVAHYVLMDKVNEYEIFVRAGVDTQ